MVMGGVAGAVNSAVGTVNMTKYDWSVAFLQHGGWPVSNENIAFVSAWIDREGTKARWNPLATTRVQSGAAGGMNSVGVQNYADFATGLAADVATVQGYSTISSALASGNGSAALQPAGFWGSYSGEGGDGAAYVATFKNLYANYLGNLNAAKVPMLAAGASTSPSPGGGGAGSAAVPTGTAHTGVLAPFKVPAGGTLYKVNGVEVVAYKVGPGTTIYYDSSGQGDTQYGNTSGLPFGGSFTAQQFAQIVTPKGGFLVHGGMWSAFANTTQGAGSGYSAFPTYQAWLQNELKILTGGNQAELGDPAVMDLLVQRAAGIIDDTELAAKLKDTPYYQQHTTQQLNWPTLSKAEQEYQVHNEAASLAAQYMNTVGKPIDLTDSQLLYFATAIASGAQSEAYIVNYWLRPLAAKDPGSPWSQQLMAMKKSENQPAIDAQNGMAHVQQLYDTWGIQASPATLQKLGVQFATGQLSDATIVSGLQQQAQTLYPWMKNVGPGTDTTTAAQPWIQAYQSTLEKPADIFTGPVQQALQQGQSLYDFQKQLRGTPDFLNTTNGKQAMSGAYAEVSRRMGFTAS